MYGFQKQLFIIYIKKTQIWKTDFELNGSVRQEIKLKP